MSHSTHSSQSSKLTIAGRDFNSRLLVGTGKFSSNEAMRDALAASGTEIIEEFGPEHQKTGKPICYTSGDSVFQIAAHEDIIPIEDLYKLCEITRKLVDPYKSGRVIARPFIGEPGNYKRSGNRRDYATPAHGPTLLDVCRENNRDVYANVLETDVPTTWSDLTDDSLIGWVGMGDPSHSGSVRVTSSNAPSFSAMPCSRST